MRELAAVLLMLGCCAVVAHAAEPLPAAGGDKTPFPTQSWSEAAPSDPQRLGVERIIARAFEGVRPAALANTRAMVVVRHGHIVGERYSAGITRDTRLPSYSMAKSVLHAVLGLAIGDGLVDPEAPAPVPEWQEGGDPRRAITVRQLAQMTDGLAFRERYDDPDTEVMQMLFGAGRGDVGAAAAQAPLAHKPGTRWSYSSGSANILARILRDRLGGREAYRAYLDERLFKPLGMTSAVPEFDASGTWIASSFVQATARDFARFGLLYLRRGFWDGRQLIPPAWVALASAPTAPAKGAYGALFWLNARDPEIGKPAAFDRLPEDLFFARGHGGQITAIVPGKDAVIVMLNTAFTGDAKAIADLIADVVDALPDGAEASR
jgi:CubicO group peptidase (beta-lactamase class C family)